MRFFTAKTITEFETISEGNPNMVKAVGKLVELSQEEREWMLEDAREKARMDANAREEYINRTATENGMRVGMEKGMEKGILKGIIDGKLEVARSLLALGQSLEFIAKATGLTTEELEKL